MADGSSNIQKKLIALVVVTLGSVLLALLAIRFHTMDEIESTTWDVRLRYIAHLEPPDPRIRIIMIDQTSLDYFARDEKIYWTWPRSLYTRVIKFLEAGHAKAVAFDILFTEPSYYGVEEDDEFAKSMRGPVKVVVASALRSSKLNEVPEDMEIFRRQIESNSNFAAAKKTFSELPSVPHFVSASVPIKELMLSASAIGNVSALPDSDGIFRHAYPGGIVHDLPVLSLPFALFTASGLGELSPEALVKLTDERGRLAVRFAGPARTYHTDPIAAVIKSITQIEAGVKPQIDPETFRDAVVFVGMDAPGLLDLRPTPLSEIYPGVEFNATILDNLTHQRFIKKASLSQNLLAVGLLVLAATAATLFITGLLPHLLALGGIAGIYVSSCFYFASIGIWLMMAMPLAVAALAITLCFAYQYQLEGRQHRFLRHAFRHYVSSTVIDRIVEDPASLALGGERRELTIFFSDIEGFTSISESIDAGKLVQLLNLFLSEMARIILSNGGTVDKYVGDAIVAFWNAPIAVPDHAKRGVIAALACQAKLEALRDTFQKDFGRPLKMRIGLHTGTVSVGNFGSLDRFTYTMIGDSANLASRLEGANKYFGTYILISGETVKRLPREIECRKIAEIIVSGRKTPTSVYEPLTGTLTLERKEQLQTYLSGLEAFDAGELAKARDLFLTIPKDPVARRYVTRIERDLQRPAGSEPWNSVWSLLDK